MFLLLINNPAARLLKLIQALRFHDANRPAMDAWRSVLAVAPNDNPRLLERFGLVVMLPRRAKQAVLEVPDISHEIYLRWLPQVESAFVRQSLSGPLHQYLGQIDKTVELGIEFCAELLARQRPENTLGDDDLQALRKEFALLLTDLDVADIPLVLKHRISRHLAEVVKAIDDYQIAGVEALEHALETVVGAAVLDAATSEMFRGTTMGRRIWKAIKDTLIILSLLHSTIQLPGDVAGLQKLLLAPPLERQQSVVEPKSTSPEPNVPDLSVPTATQLTDTHGQLGVDTPLSTQLVGLSHTDEPPAI
jgi:hypothetical protein